MEMERAEPEVNGLLVGASGVVLGKAKKATTGGLYRDGVFVGLRSERGVGERQRRWLSVRRRNPEASLGQAAPIRPKRKAAVARASLALPLPPPPQQASREHCRLGYCQYGMRL